MTPSVKKTVLPTQLFWADVIRVLAIIGVVTIHSFTLPPLALNFESGFNWLWFIVAKTCVPLFLLLSGALLLGKKETEIIFYSKRLQRILWPWLLWSLVFLVTKYSVQLISIPHAVRTFTQILTAEFSFLPALFCLYLLMPFMRVLVSHLSLYKRWQLIGLWFLGISALPYLRDTLAFPAVVDNGLVRQTINYSGFIFLGYELRLWLESTINHQKVLVNAAVVFIAAVIGTFLIQLKNPSTPPLFLSYVAPLIVISSVAAFCILFELAQKYQTTQFKKLVEEFSGASFGVFFVHPLIVSLVLPKILTANITWKNILVTLMSLSLSFLLILLLRQIPGLRKKVS